MIVSSSPPLQRVHEILQRMQTDTENVECLKTCCGALAILAKDEANKLLIARDGTRLILTVMEGHATRPDLQEAVCDLLWSLAFNNSLVKEVVGRQGGIALILKGMSSHLSSPELVKSACGALSNMCQNTYNQNLISAHGGIRTILSALHSHRMNAPLLPFVFDALASLIVGNQRNGLLVADGGGIRGVLSTMSLHSGRREVVKSGCHALAILSDIQGQGARIAGAEGVKVLLPALRAHVRFLHLHRIAAIVLLRMLQEAAVARDIACHGGVVIMLGMLREHAREEETVAATVHILYLITHADVMRGGVEDEIVAYEKKLPADAAAEDMLFHLLGPSGHEQVARHFSGFTPAAALPLNSGMTRGSGGILSPSRGGVAGPSLGGVGGGGGARGIGGVGSMAGAQGVECSSMSDRELFSTGSVRALVQVLQAHMARKDIVRAAMRSAANLIRVRPVVQALTSEPGALPTLLQCLALHSTSRGITDSAVTVAGALLAAAHAGGWATGSSSSGWGYKGYLENGVNSGGTAFNSGNTSPNGRNGSYKLSVLSPTSSSTTNVMNGSNNKQRPAQRHSPLPISLPVTMSFGLRFAYIPLHDIRGGATLEAGLRGQRSKSSAGVVSASDAPSVVTGHRGADNGSSAGARTAVPAGVGGEDVGAPGPRKTAGDAGSWNASMQALCAMLRARRRDPALAGLVFLALESCLSEWAQACDAGAEQTTIRSGGAGWRPLQLGPEVNAATVSLAMTAGTTGKGTSVSGASVPKGECEAMLTAGATAVAAVGLSAISQPQRSHPPAAMAVLTGGRAVVGPREKEVMATAAAREKMQLGVRESLKAGLVWAEAIPLGRSRPSAMPEGADRGGTDLGFGGGGGGKSGIGMSLSSQGFTTELAASEVAFNGAMAEAVERLCRLFRRGFVELGFGRLGAAAPLSEGVALKNFDTNVPEVLESLRAARQPDTSREAVETLIRMFLPAEPPDPPPYNADVSTSGAAAGSAAAAAVSLTAAGHKHGDGRSGAAAARANDVAGIGRGQNSLPRRSGPGKVSIGNGVPTAGTGGTGSVSSGGNESDGGDSGTFWDEAGAGGAGLVISSPLDLEPILTPPSPSGGVLCAASSGAIDGSCSFAAGVGGTTDGVGGGAMGAAFPGGSSMMSSRFSTGGFGGGAAAAGTGDDRLWLVYDGASAAGKGVISRVNAPDPYWLGRPSPGAVCPYAHSMNFHSAFEGANLMRAVQRGPVEYDLFLRPDLHTHGHTQWFYFAVGNTHPPGAVGDSVVRFNVVNLTKPDSLFAMGMRPVLYSHRDAAGKGLGWRRCGHGIDYRSNGYSWYKLDGSQASFYTLSLSVTFPNPGDTYRLAHAHPYSYSDHKRHLAGLLADERTARYLNHAVLCQTLGGNDCDLLTVTDSQQAPVPVNSESNSRTVNTNTNQQSSSPAPGPIGSQQDGGLPDQAGSTEGDNQRNHAPDGTAPAVGSATSTPTVGVTVAGNSFTTRAETKYANQRVSTGSGAISSLGNGGVASGRVGVGGKGVGGGGGGDTNSSSWRRAVGNHGAKRCVVISARVHPGEVPASWMMRGMLDFLAGESAEARLLRSLFVFKIVPMLNPDGVAFGNNRCSLAGVDLNRQWKRPSRTLHPTVFWLKQQIRQEQARRGVAMYIDLHGHSRKMNIFMYGADEKRRGVSCPSARVFPKLLSWNRLGRKYVSFKECSFAVKKGRESTARVVVARDLGIGNSYTVESTFCGVDFGPLKDHHLNTDHLQEAGVAICDALLDYYMPNQGERERAHRQLLVRDGVDWEAGPSTGPMPSVAVGVNEVDRAGGDHEDEALGGDDSGRGAGEHGQDDEPRDADDDVVDNNDDLESEDDNDSEPPEALNNDEEVVDAETENATAVQPQSSTEITTTDIQQQERDPSQHSGVGKLEGTVSIVSEGQAPHQIRNFATTGSTHNGNRGAGRGLLGGEHAGQNKRNPVAKPWPGIDWDEGETGGSSGGTGGGIVRRWGRVIEEAPEQQQRTDGGASGEFDHFPNNGQAKSVRIGTGYGGGGSAKSEGTPAAVASASAAAAAAVRAAVDGEMALGGGGEGGGGGKRDKRRTSGRAQKALSLSSAHRGGRGNDRGSSGRQQRARGHVGNGAAARRASDAALQAATNVLAACSTSNCPPTITNGGGKARRRVRSLPTNNVNRSAPESNGGGGSRGSSSRGSGGSGGSSRSAGAGGARSRGRGGSGTGGSGPDEAQGPVSAEGCVVELTTGSALQLDGDRGAVATKGGMGIKAGERGSVMVKRGGNPRWLSPPTDLTAPGGNAEGSNWNGVVGNLPSNLPRRKVSPTQSPHDESNNGSAHSRGHAPELAFHDHRININRKLNGDGGSSKSSTCAGGIRGRVVSKAFGRGHHGKGISVVLGNGSGVATPAILALPILEDGSVTGFGAASIGRAGKRADEWGAAGGDEGGPPESLFSTKASVVAAGRGLR